MDEKPTFPPDFWRDLAASCPQGPVSEQVARDWFDSRWMEMAAWYEGKPGKPKWKLRVARWWSTVSADDLQRARAYGEAHRKDAKARELAAARERAFQADYASRVPIPTDLPPLRVTRR